MRPHFLLLFFCLFTAIDGFPQTNISGTIIDSNTGEPVESVYIRNQNQPENSALSDAKGFFSIKAALSDTLNLYRIGYGYEIIACTSMVLNIKMNPEDYQLDELVISNEQADAIYRKALANLINNYLPGSAIYLWHGIEEEDEGRRRESYARYLSTANHKKDGKMDFDLRLLELNHLENTYKAKLVDFPYHISGISSDVYIKKQDKMLKIDSEDDSLILLRNIQNLKTSNKSVAIDIIINKSDTVLLCRKFSLYESDMELKMWGIHLGTALDYDAYYNLNIIKDEDGYCIDKMESKLSFYIGKKKKYNKKENTITFLKTEDSVNPQELKKLNGGTKQLFKLDANSSARFWEPYLSN